MQKARISLEVISEFFGRFAARHLDEYVEYVTNNNIAFAIKEINDPVWGTITLSPIEVAILDSPLLQRLRQVRQLGVVHWVYPGAVHTRFEHTLGVLSQTQNLINALNSFPNRTDAQFEISRGVSQTLRLAALLHDIGHGCFSHVSEKALDNYTEFQVVISAFNKSNSIDKSKISEIAAYYIINSDSFRKFVDALFGKVDGWPSLSSDFEKNKTDVIKAIASIVISKNFIAEYPTAQDLISGPFDADKIDYLMRDAKYCGVPNVVDTSRLIQKLEMRNVAQSDIPGHLADGVKLGLAGYRLFGIKASGARVLDELVMAKTFLHSKVYRHQKVQAIESMVEALFRVFEKQFGVIALLNMAYEFSDEEILALTSENISQRMEGRGIGPLSDSAEAKRALPIVSQLTSRLRMRRLFVRILLLASSYPGDTEMGENKKQARNLVRLNNDLKNVQKLGDLKKTIVTDVNWIKENAPNLMLGRTDLITEYAITITPPSSASGGAEVDRALIFHKNGKITKFGDGQFNTDAWSSAYDYSGAAAGYIFADPPYALAAYLAAEKAIFSMYEVILPVAALAGSQVSQERIKDAKKQLSELGYYRSMPIELRPMPNRLEDIGANRAIGEFCKRLAAYQSPVDREKNEKAVTDLEQKTINWLKQFEKEEYVDKALQLLKNVKMLTRADVVDAGSRFFEKNPEFKGSYICGFGSPKDSGSIIAYYANDLPKDIHAGVYSIEEATIKGGESPVVFFDDFIGSGGQACDVLSGWFGDVDGRGALGEERLALHADTVAFLRGRKVGFLFVAGWEEGRRKLQEHCNRLGLDATIFIDIEEAKIPFAFEGDILRGDDEEISRFKEFCNGVGKALLSDKGQDKAKQIKRGLGYGNRAMLLAFPHNVPTQTLTCMRERGQYQGSEWQEILLRRQKQ